MANSNRNIFDDFNDGFVPELICNSGMESNPESG